MVCELCDTEEIEEDFLDVLILVLMENGLRVCQEIKLQTLWQYKVLILVLMEFGLWDG